MDANRAEDIEGRSGGTATEAAAEPAAVKPGPDKRDTVVLGIGMMLLGILLFVINDVMGKWLVATYTVGQVLLIRSIAAFLILAPLVMREGSGPILRPARPGLQAVRVLLSTVEVAFFYWAVSAMPLADVIAFYLAGPIWVAALAGPLLGEKIGWRRWAAVLVGFLGVIVALRPSGASLTVHALIAVFGSFAFALMMITSRLLRGTSDTVLVTWQTGGALAFGLVAAPFGWVTPTAVDLGLLGLLGVVAALAHMCVNRSLKLAPAAVVVPYQYTQIAWAILFGWLIFGDLPDTQLVVGAAIIIASGLYIFTLEQRGGA
jgi:drug/metabolite transporter (DMT)-like permease